MIYHNPEQPSDELPDDGDLVRPKAACPDCGERRIDWLVWTEDEAVRCASCGGEYRPDAIIDHLAEKTPYPKGKPRPGETQRVVDGITFYWSANLDRWVTIPED